MWSGNSINNAADVASQFFLTTDGYAQNATYDNSDLLTSGTSTVNGMTFGFSGDNHPGSNIETLTIDVANEPLIISVVGTGSFDVTANWDSLGQPGNGGNSFTAGPVDITSTNSVSNGTEYINLSKTPVGLSDLGLVDSDILTSDNAASVLQQLDNALEYVSESRAFYGARINQMQSAYRVNAQMFESVSAAKAQITDADFASETAQLTQSQIVEQASIAVRAQAKSRDAQVLGLLNSTSG